jgi:hypothetical protein
VKGALSRGMNLEGRLNSVTAARDNRMTLRARGCSVGFSKNSDMGALHGSWQATDVYVPKLPSAL